MITTNWLLVGVAILICYFVFFGLRVGEERFRLLKKKLDGLSDSLEDMKNEFKELSLKLDQVEWNTLSEYEKNQTRFENAKPLTLSHLRQLKAGATMRLMSQEWDYPSEQADHSVFEYKLDHIDETTTHDGYNTVHGHWRFSVEDEWAPYDILANEKESVTRTRGGTVKCLWGTHSKQIMTGCKATDSEEQS
ncbi:MAG: hypothetical protein NT105_20950 [Verrucomicrobia bacterium]|nr:hypothetical protein [Verrucomicrobiota bacterium]